MAHLKHPTIILTQAVTNLIQTKKEAGFFFTRGYRDTTTVKTALPSKCPIWQGFLGLEPPCVNNHATFSNAISWHNVFNMSSLFICILCVIVLTVSHWYNTALQWNCPIWLGFLWLEPPCVNNHASFSNAISQQYVVTIYMHSLWNCLDCELFSLRKMRESGKRSR